MITPALIFPPASIMSPLRRLAASVIALALSVASGCGDNGKGGVTDANSEPDAEVNTCTTLLAAYGDLGTVSGKALVASQDKNDPQAFKFLSAQIALNAETPADLLFIELWEDTPPYSPSLEPGSVTITKLQTEVVGCGACVFISPDHVDANMIDFHMASAGTVHIDEVDPTPGTGRLKGRLENIKLRAVTLSASGDQTDVEGGCKTSVDAVEFDFTVEEAPAALWRARRN